ncbi:MAG: DUF5685 family protein [Oscillospiraceae bacterium]|jgi:hypothetical protein|nr:DUF5685 family protein [Oscillospiraceae bacterium]
MFGSVRPFQPELRHRESAQYKAVYCGLCHTLSKRYGARSRLLANYDFVLLSMLYWGGGCESGKRRCVRHPFRKQPVCLGGDASDYAADALMLFTDWQLRDTVRDEGGGRRLLARFLRLLYRKPFGKAKERLPEEAAACGKQMAELWALEDKKDASLWKPASAFGEMLRCLGAPGGRAAESLLYHLGRWIYIADAFCDRVSDAKTGAYNAVTLHLGENPDPNAVGEALASEQEAVLKALDLLPDGVFGDILRNILTLGLRTRGHEALYGKSKEKEVTG